MSPDTEEDAKQFRERFFVSYRGLRAWHRDAWRKAAEIGGLKNCDVRTRMGRRRFLPRGGKDWTRFAGLVNTPVQGTCADGLKHAMVDLAANEEFQRDAQMVATVHDELVVCVPEEKAEAIRDIVVKAMREAMAKHLSEVPIEVEAKLCKRWGDK